MASLTVSVVTFRPDLPKLVETFRSLGGALEHARGLGAIESAQVFVVDNDDPWQPCAFALQSLAAELPEWVACEHLRGHGNIGFGRGHNYAIRSATSDYHLVLNPDVVLEQTSLIHALTFMEEHREVGMLTPFATDGRGAQQYLCREYPSLWVLFLRGFAPGALKRRCEQWMATYEMRSRVNGKTLIGVPTASGCFMFLRTEVVKRLGGFSDRYFLYFEDTDLSIRLARETNIAYVPTVRIVHTGGHAAKKGLWHILVFSRSALTFFRSHFWKLV
jgi:GT2 family glycosyltransferase